MAEENYDPWETESGLSDLESFTFKGVKFGYDADYMDGERCCMIVEDGVGVTDTGDTVELRKLYPCGPNWEPTSGGKGTRRETGAQKFNGNSAMGLLVNAAVALWPELKKRGAPTEAATWEGTQWKMTNKEFTNKIGGETVTYNRLLPVEFLGEGKKAEKAKRATKKVEKAEAAEDEATEDVAEKAESNGAVPAALKIKLKKLAKTTIEAGGDFDQFMEDAFDIDGVSGNNAAEGSLDGVWEAASEGYNAG